MNEKMMQILGNGKNNTKEVMDSGVTSIEEVRKSYEEMLNYEPISLYEIVELRAWLAHSESRHRNKNKPFSYSNYTRHMSVDFYIEQVKLGIVDVSDLGGKEAVLADLEKEKKHY